MLNEGNPEESDCLRNGDGEKVENASASAERVSLFPLASSSQPLTEAQLGLLTPPWATKVLSTASKDIVFPAIRR